MTIKCFSLSVSIDPNFRGDKAGSYASVSYDIVVKKLLEVILI